LDDVYYKHHLVPFGEFLPLEDVLNLTPLVGFAGFQRGPGPRVLRGHDLATGIAPMICFEAIFPWYAKSPDADWLVNTSNDGWYGNTPGPYQHLAMTRLRAIEQGIPVVRSATTGISAVIDAYGRIIESLPYGTEGSIVTPLPSKTAVQTPYSQYGESLFFIAFTICCCVFLGSRRIGI
jgi:apolipoprotein N-acyltransferase